MSKNSNSKVDWQNVPRYLLKVGNSYLKSEDVKQNDKGVKSVNEGSDIWFNTRSR